MIYLDFDAKRWARYEGKTRTLRGVDVTADMRTAEWTEALFAIRYNPTALSEPESA